MDPSIPEILSTIVSLTGVLTCLCFYGVFTSSSMVVSSSQHGIALSVVGQAVINGLASGATYAIVTKFRTFISGQVIYVDPSWLLVWLLKIYLDVYYVRFLDQAAKMKIRIRVANALLSITYFATIVSLFLCCQSTQKHHEADRGLARVSLAEDDSLDTVARRMPRLSDYSKGIVPLEDCIWLTVALHILTDVYILMIPTPMIWRLCLNSRERRMLITFFSGGAMALLAGMLRCALVLAVGPSEVRRKVSWVNRHKSVAIVIGGIPLAYTLAHNAARNTNLRL